MKEIQTFLQGKKFIITALIGIAVYLMRWQVGEITVGQEVYPAVTSGEFMDFTWKALLAIFAKLRVNKIGG